MTGRPEYPGSFLDMIVEGLLVLLPPAAPGPWAGSGRVFGYRILVVLLVGCAVTGWIYPAWVRRFSRAACAIVVVAVAWAVTGVVGAMRLGPHRDLSSLMGAGLALAGAWSVARLISDSTYAVSVPYAMLRSVGRSQSGRGHRWPSGKSLPRDTWALTPTGHGGTIQALSPAGDVAHQPQPLRGFPGYRLRMGRCGWRAKRYSVGADSCHSHGGDRFRLLLATDSRIVYAALLLAVMVRLWAVRRWRWVLPGVVIAVVVVIVVTHLHQAGLVWHRFIGVLIHHNDEAHHPSR